MKRKLTWIEDPDYQLEIAEWEEALGNRLRHKRLDWGFHLLCPTVLAGIAVAGTDWRTWLGIGACWYVAIWLFGFLEELNENLRYIREQLKPLKAKMGD